VTVVLHKNYPALIAIYKKMKKCFFAWVYGYLKKVCKLAERVIKVLLEALGPGYYHRARLGSKFDPETLDVNIEFPDTDWAEDRIRVMAIEYEIEDEEQEEEIEQPKVVIEFADPQIVTTLGELKSGNTFAAGSGPSKFTARDASSGASTVNLDCPKRKREQHKNRAVQNALLRGELADSAAENVKLQEKVQQLKLCKSNGVNDGTLARWRCWTRYS